MNKEELRKYLVKDKNINGLTFDKYVERVENMTRAVIEERPTNFREIDVFSLGENEAYHLGISTQKLKREIMIGTALCVGASVSVVGGVGFIGLMVPHILRLLGGSLNKYLLISSSLGGAIILLLADTFARTIFSPIEIPVGTVTAFLGGPFFIWLLIKQKTNY